MLYIIFPYLFKVCIIQFCVCLCVADWLDNEFERVTPLIVKYSWSDKFGTLGKAVFKKNWYAFVSVIG